ncbi:MAG TPA: SLBB domain-containing protein [Terracidiphilus sp.]|nr:SLBB domain-containing protein [Terracidiphilus sp.]
MTKGLLAQIALFMFATTTLLNAQSQLDSNSTSIQQGSVVDCSDPLMASSSSCSAQQQFLLQQQLQQGFSNPTPGSLPTSTSSPNELSPINGFNAQRLDYWQLPPQLPTEFQKFVAATIGQYLPVYGESLFQNVPSTFSPNNLAPVPSNYVIGPDDELRVRIWGQVRYTGNLRVDRSGNVYLPLTGNVHVAGLHYSELDQALRDAVGKMYRNFDLSVDLGQIRSIQVYVTGQARRPGVYTVSSLSTLVDALFASGGPSKQGSLRHILLNRSGKTVTDFDLYDLLIHGDKSKDVRLEPEDVLFIPPAGPEVAISGSVRVPAIYELRTGETLGDLLDDAGKTTALSSTARISLDRTGPNQMRQAAEFKFDKDNLNTSLRDGDIVRIFPILPAYEKTITLRGNVANPGRFAWKPGMHVSDIIPDRDALLSRDYWWKRSHLGLPVPEFETPISTLGRSPKMIEQNSQGFTTDVTQETLSTALNPPPPNPDGSSSTQQTQPDTNGNQPGQQSPNQPMLKNPKYQESSTGAIGSELSENSINNSSNGTGNGNPSHREQMAKQPKNTVRLTAPDIDWDYAVIERLDPETLKTSLIPFDLGKLLLKHDPSEDITLQPGDTITIFSQDDIRVPREQQTKYVDLEGEVQHAGTYSVKPGETLRDLVKRAGGLTSHAYLYGASFTRESTRKLQQQRLDEYVQTITMETERGTQALAMAGTGNNAASTVTASQTAAQGLIERLSKIKATGRIVFQFNPDSAGDKDVPEISLENGDKFFVPFAPATVNIVGAVYNQNSFLYHEGWTVDHYLKLAGGANRNADWRHAFVIRADGSVVSKTSVKGALFWHGSFSRLKLYRGDTIVVPDKTLRPPALRGILDWTQVFSQLALGAAAISVL